MALWLQVTASVCAFCHFAFTLNAYRFCNTPQRFFCVRHRTTAWERIFAPVHSLVHGALVVCLAWLGGSLFVQTSTALVFSLILGLFAQCAITPRLYVFVLRLCSTVTLFSALWCTVDQAHNPGTLLASSVASVVTGCLAAFVGPAHLHWNRSLKLPDSAHDVGELTGNDDDSEVDFEMAPIWERLVPETWSLVGRLARIELDDSVRLRRLQADANALYHRRANQESEWSVVME